VLARALGAALLVTATCMATAAPSSVKPEALARRLSVAEQQKMLPERLTRSWAMKAIGIVRGRAAIQFDEDSRRFVRQLKTLQTEADTPELKENYSQLEQQWNRYLDLAEADPGPGGAKPLSDQGDELVRTAEKGAHILSARVGGELAEGLHMTGQARMQSQRMAKTYFVKVLGITAPYLAADMKQSEADYQASMKRLRELSESRPKSAAVLSLVDQQWAFFSEALRAPAVSGDRDQLYQTLARASDSLLSALEDLGKSFEQ
jgi:hypothetical protein